MKNNVKRVRFQVYARPGAEVFIAGNFNHWNPREFRFREENFKRDATDDDAIYTCVVSLPPGEHEYKFIVNGQWMVDPGNKDKRRNEFGSCNSVRRVSC